MSAFSALAPALVSTERRGTNRTRRTRTRKEWTWVYRRNEWVRVRR
jgi:hypothetical protein